MIPNYEKFTTDTGFGSPQLLRDAVDSVWAWLESSYPPGELRDTVERIDAQAPDAAEFASPFTSAALDAANATAILLEAIISPADADPFEVASLARDTVDLYVQQSERLYPNDRQLEEEINCHPLMQAELQCQKRDLEELAKWTGTRSDSARCLRDQPPWSKGGSLDPTQT